MFEPPRLVRRLRSGRVLVAVGALLGAPFLLLGEVGHLAGRAGGEVIRAQVLSAVQERIAGTLDATRLELGLDRLVLHGLKLRDPEGELVAEVDQVEARLPVKALLAGRLVVEAVRLARPRLHLRKDARGLNLARALAPRLSATADGPGVDTPSTVHLDKLSFEGGHVSYRQEGAPLVELASLAGSGRLAYDVSQAALDARLELTGQATEPLAGPLSLALDGTLAGTHGRLELGLHAPGLRLEASGHMEGTAQRLEVSALELSPEVASAVLPGYPLRGPVLVSGEASRQGDEAQLGLALQAGTVEASLTGKLDVARRRLSGRLKTGELKALLPALDGKASVDFEVEGASASPRLRLRGDVAGLKASLDAHYEQERLAGELRLASGLDARARFTASASRVDLAVTAQRQGRKLARIEGFLRAPPGKSWTPELFAETAVQLEGTVEPLALAEARPMLVKLAPAGWAAQLPDAKVTTRLRGTGTLGEPRLELDAHLAGLRAGAVRLGTADVRGTYTRGQGTLTAVLHARGGGRLTVEGEVSGRWEELAGAPLTARVRASRLDAALVRSLVPRVRELSGRVSGDARLDGTLGAPRVQGTVEWQDGRVATRGYGDYRQLRLKLAFTGERLELTELSGRSGGGSLKLSGAAVREGRHLQVELQGDLGKLPVFFDGQLQAVVTARTALKGEVSPEGVHVRSLDVAEAQVVLPEVRKADVQELKRPRDIVLVRNGRPIHRRKRREEELEPSVPAHPGKQSPRFELVVNAPRNVWVRGADVNAEVGLPRGLRVEYGDEFSLFGELRLLRGRVSVLGRQFELQRGSNLRFAGSPRQPHVDLMATHIHEREGVTVRLALRGQGKDAVLEATSTPSLPEAEVFTLLATGRRVLPRGASAPLSGGAAVSMAGTLLASQLKRSLAAYLPLDVLSIEAGERGLAGTRIEAGRYLTDKLYLGYSARLGARRGKDNTHSARLEYQLGRRWSLETEYGNGRAGGVDLFWRRDY